jgi:hypothetical protein
MDQLFKIYELGSTRRFGWFLRFFKVNSSKSLPVAVYARNLNLFFLTSII